MVIIMTLTINTGVMAYIREPIIQYPDVAPNYWAYNDIAFATEKKWFSGYSDGTFGPNNKISRAEAVKVLVSLLERDVAKVYNTSFSDVSASDWYAPYVEVGKDLFLNLKDGGGFRPNQLITREEAIYALVRGMNLNLAVKYVDESLLETFTDSEDISEGIKPYFTIAMQEGLISGYSDGTVRAQESLTRAEFASLLTRCYRMGFVEEVE